VTNLKKIYKKSKDIVEREIEGEMILIPIASDVVDLENDLIFSLNEIGKEIWQKIDGRKKVLDIVRELEDIYDIEEGELTRDVLNFLEELVKKDILLDV